MGAIDGTKIGMSNRFRLVVEPGTHDLGTWSGIGGLDVTWTMNTYQAGDLGNTIFLYPGGTKFSNVTLTRTVCDETNKMKEWLDSTSFNHEMHTMTIDVFDESYTKPVVSFTLENAVPTNWKIDKLDAKGSNVLTETLTVAHSGFLNDAQVPE